MKIRALRVAEVGRFATPVALEGLADGLSVVVGDNEAGKSTLFQALLAAFQAPHSSNHRSITALQPYDGGSPLIEVDFEAHGTPWRLRKRFLQGRFAELHNLQSGTVVARNADVQAQLDALRAGPAGLERFGLLWVAQGDTLSHLRVPEGTTATLRSLVQSEIEGASADEPARRMLARAGERLDMLLSHKRTRPARAYDDAIKASAAAELQRKAMAERRAAGEDRLVRLTTATVEADQLRSPVSRTARATAIDDADRALRQASDDRARARVAAEALRTAESEAAAARLAHETWHRALSRHQAAIDQRQRLAGEIATARLAHIDAAAKCNALQVEQDTLSAKIAALDRDIAVVRAATVRRESLQRRDAVSAQLATIQALQAEMQAVTAAIAGIAIDETALKQLRQLIASRDRLDDRLAAESAVLAITPAPGATRRFQIDGAGIDVETSIRVDRPIVVDIEGVGRISVRPGGAEAIAATRTERDRIAAELDAAFARFNVLDLTAAEARLRERQQAEARRNEARVRLTTMAPDGIDAVHAAHVRLVAETAQPIADALPTDPLSVLEQSRGSLAVRLRDVEQSLTDARRRFDDVRRNELRLETLIGEADRQVQDLATTLGPAESRPAHAEAIDQARAAGDAKVAAAARDAAAWREALIDDDRLAVLERHLAEARAADRAAEERLHRLDLDIRQWETELKADSDIDIEQEAEAADRAAAKAAARVTDLTEEIAALRLLDQMLTNALADEHQRIVAPVAERVRPYLEMVLPGASLHIDDSLSPAGLVRNGRRETLDRISRGTAEQVAIIARLGLARLLADRGSPAPLILDDALVYADDRRIASVLSAMTAASAHHQVIVLTCRERAFEALARHRVELRPWTPMS